MNPVQDQELSAEQVVQLTNAMIAVARVDGITDAEAALIRAFYDGARRPEMPTADTLLAGDAAARFDVKRLAGSTPEFADTVVLMCLMTAYADGKLSADERDCVQSIADGAGIDATRFAEHLSRVHDELIGALSHLPDSGSVARVVQELS